MKILLDGRLISNKPTGISRYSREMVKIYQNYYGYENVKVIVNEELDEKPFETIATHLKPFNMKHFFIFHKFLKKIDADIYHTLYYSNSFFKDKSKKEITTVHDLMYKLVDNFFSKNKLINYVGIKYYDFIVKNSLKNSELVISVSNTTKKDVKELFKKDSIFVPEGLNELCIEKNEISEIKNKKYLLYIGNSRPHKNLEFLCEVFKELNLELSLVLIGTQKDYSDYNSNIISLGFLEDSQIKWAYENAEAFIFPSLYEGFGLPILEALDNNCKVISSNAGALREFNTELIAYFDPKDKDELKKCILNVSSQIFDETEKIKVLETYSWRNTEKYMREIFKKIGGGKKC